MHDAKPRQLTGLSEVYVIPDEAEMEQSLNTEPTAFSRDREPEITATEPLAYELTEANRS